MKVVVLGAGRMGRAAAWDLARQPGMTHVKLVDRDPDLLTRAGKELEQLLHGGPRSVRVARIEGQTFDLDQLMTSGPSALCPVIEGYSVVLSSADYRFNEAATLAAIEAKVHLCDLGGNLFVVERQLALSERAERAGITVVPDCGLAPGMAGLIGALGVSRFDSVEKLELRVGGLPAHPKPPLNYKLVFSVRGLINEYLEPAEVLIDGKPTRVPSLTDVERITFPAPYGELEAFNTSGGSSTLPRTLRGKVRNLDYKTIRYPGHCAAFAGMHAIGLLSDEPFQGVQPRPLVEALLEASLNDDDTDVVLVRVTVDGLLNGERRRLSYEIIDLHDAVTGHSAMARTTAYPAAAVAYMLAAGAVEARGVLPGELCVPLDPFLSAVRARGIEVKERWE
ncbi:MAG: saccharopine dehydrogenase NADP-binding domain-containing protein [Polyangiaceae bacterium]|nr:saccharopine dehydrogenase NADP-binding domain-containing protein [Polyangiaceae bacterium]MCW5790281.1 saccharopine dehydrogenase NADP-binding domain-containing protein [Polyangiaceae bacterium]